MRAPVPEVVVVGAGVCGLTVAVRLAESGARVHVIAELGPGRSTSAAAGAIWDPLQADHPRRIDWAMTSFAVFARMARSRHPAVRMLDAIEAARVPIEAPGWATGLPGFAECRPGDLPPGFAGGWRFRAPVIDMPRYLAGLERRLRRAGGKLRTGRRLTDPAEAFAVAPIVVNCAGIGAAGLVGDPDLVPVRGRLVVVRNPGRTESFAVHTDDEGALTYLLPHGDILVLGGSAEKGESDPVVEADEVTREIRKRCAAIFPEVAQAKVLGYRSGIRPKRTTVRLEYEHHAGGHLVHNYGHGGSGVTLSHGCAAEVVRIVRRLRG